MDFSKDRWGGLFHHTSEALFVLDKDWRIVAMNPKAEAVSGWTKSGVEGQRLCTELFVCHNAEGRELCDIDCPKQKALSEGRSGDPINVKILHKDGSLSFIPGRGLFLPAPPQAKGDRKGPGEPLAAIMIRDEGDQRKLRETLMEQGRRDPLTGLFHRQYFEEIYGIEVKRAKRHGGTMTLLMLDIRGLKEINQRHGTKAGDGVLREIGQMILACVREIDIAARFGGDEFVILLHGVDEARAKIFTRRLRQKLDGLNQSEVLPERVVLNLALEVTDGEYDRILDRVMGVLDQHRGEPL